MRALITILAIVALAALGVYFYVANEFAEGFDGHSSGFIICVDANKIKDEYIAKYVDSIFICYPDFRVPNAVRKSDNYQSIDYEHLHLTKFYFTDEPVEVYFIQWIGPGCVNIRFVHNPLTDESYGVYIDGLEEDEREEEENRVKKRFENDVITKLEALILKNEPSDSIYLNY